MDENNVYIIKDVIDSNSNLVYETRYLDINGIILTKEDYEIKYNNEENVYIACFVGCTHIIVVKNILYFQHSFRLKSVYCLNNRLLIINV